MKRSVVRSLFSVVMDGRISVDVWLRQRYGSFSGALFEALQEWSAGHGDEDTDGGLDEISRDAGQSDDP